MQKWMLLVILAMSMFIIVIDTTIMNVSISALVVDLNTTVGGIQSAIALFALVMASFMLIGGKLSVIFGKKRTFLVGLIIFGIGTATASFSQTLGVLLIGWSVLEGLGSALMIPNIQTLLRGQYQGKDLAFAYGIISAVGAVGAALGPIVGGYLTTFHSWRWAFRLEVAIVILVLILSPKIPSELPPERRPKFDFLGGLLAIIGFSSIVTGILIAQTYGLWLATKPLAIAGLELAPFGLSVTPFLVGIGILFLMGLILWEWHLETIAADGLFKPSLFKTPGLIPGFGVRFVHMAILASFLFIAPLLLQLTFEFTAMQTGIALLPMSLAILVFAILGAKLSARFSAKRIIQVGFICGILGLIQLIVTIQADARPRELATGVLFGLGMGLIASQILNLILSSVNPEDTPETSGLNSTFEQLGNSIGVALVGVMMLATLTIGAQNWVENSPSITEDKKPKLIAAVQTSIELVSDTQLEEILSQSEFTPQLTEQILENYAIARINAFRAGMTFLVFVTSVGLILTTGLPDRKLVSQAPED